MQLLKSPDQPTAVVVYELAETMAVVRTALLLGLRIPGDLSLVHFRNRIDDRTFIPIHTVSNMMQEVGESAVGMLLIRGALYVASRAVRGLHDLVAQGFGAVTVAPIVRHVYYKTNGGSHMSIVCLMLALLPLKTQGHPQATNDSVPALTNVNGVMADADAFNRRVHHLFLSIGTTEAQRMQDSVRGYHDALTKAGIKSVFYESPGTAHEWLTWRRSLHEFAPLLFQRQDAAQAAGDRLPQRGPGGFGGPIVLNPDDVQAYPEPPDGIDANQPGIPHGKLEMIEYDSKSVGTKRKMQVYTPPDYSSDKKYPVLYLLHGIGGDETEWERFAKPDLLLDNLLADGKSVPMIIVLPNGRAQKNDRPEGNIYAAGPAFAAFEQDLLQDVIPAIESRYSVQADQEHRALAGLSMGGGQSLNFGLAHLETFAWVGGFSSAPNTKPPAQLAPDPAAAKKKLKLLWLSCGNKDGLIRISQGVHTYLKEKDVPHVWNVDGHAHDPTEWRNNLYYFLQRVFR